jgi:hypothetical protein
LSHVSRSSSAACPSAADDAGHVDVSPCSSTLTRERLPSPHSLAYPSAVATGSAFAAVNES